jgi:hypothetical protein
MILNIIFGRFPLGRALCSYCTGLSHKAGIRVNP